MRRDIARHPEDFVSLSVSETSVHSSFQVFSVQLAYPVSPFLDREQFVCPRVHEIGECNSGDGGGKIEPRCPSGAQIESWVQPWRFPRNIQVGPEMVFFDTAEPASTDYGTVK